MSAEALVIAFRQSRSAGTAKLALIAIADFTGDGVSAVDMETLCLYTNTPEWAVEEALQRLIDLGEIEALSLPTSDEPRLFRFLLGERPRTSKEASA